MRYMYMTNDDLYVTCPLVDELLEPENLIVYRDGYIECEDTGDCVSRELPDRDMPAWHEWFDAMWVALPESEKHATAFSY